MSLVDTPQCARAAAAPAKPEPRPMGTNSTSGGVSFSALKNSTYAVDTPRTSSRWNDGTRCSPSRSASTPACSEAAWKSSPCSTSVTPSARMAAFFSVELPCGTTMVAASPWRRAAKPTDCPWLPRVALMAWRTAGCSRASVSK
jgi:hypothetical protein